VSGGSDSGEVKYWVGGSQVRDWLKRRVIFGCFRSFSLAIIKSRNLLCSNRRFELF
jgi:hypothetical protein